MEEFEELLHIIESVQAYYGKQFDGEVIIPCNFKIGVKSVNNDREYWLVNNNNQMIYKFSDSNHAKAVLELITKG